MILLVCCLVYMIGFGFTAGWAVQESKDTGFMPGFSLIALWPLTVSALLGVWAYQKWEKR